MRLTVEDNRETIKRYAHIKRSARRKTKACAVKCPGAPRTCTRERDHRGPHVAHGAFGRVLAVWDPGSGGQREGQPVARRPEAVTPPRVLGRRPVGLRWDTPVGFVEGLRALCTRVRSSAEEIAFAIFFLAFVGFAVGGFLLIYLG